MNNIQKSLFETTFVKNAGIRPTESLLSFLLKNSSCVISDIEIENLIAAVRHTFRTPMAEMFDRAVAEHALQNFTFIQLDRVSSIPELLSVNELTVDLKQTELNNALNTSNLYNKVVLNTTQMIKSDARGYTINAIDVLQNAVIRGLLVATYYDSNLWLTPQIQEYLIKSYSIILSNIISRYHNLSSYETVSVANVFAFYMAQRLATGNDDIHAPAIFNRCTFTGNPRDREEAMNICNELAPNGMSLADLARCVAEVGPDRMKSFSAGELSLHCNSLNPDPIVSRIGIEYPPYWAYMLLLSFSATKTMMMSLLSKNRLDTEGKTQFLNNLYKFKNLFYVRK